MALSKAGDSYKDKFHMQRKDQVGTATFFYVCFPCPPINVLVDVHDLINFCKDGEKENETPREFPPELYCLVFKQLNTCRDVSKSQQSPGLAVRRLCFLDSDLIYELNYQLKYQHFY